MLDNNAAPGRVNIQPDRLIADEVLAPDFVKRVLYPYASKSCVYVTGATFFQAMGAAPALRAELAIPVSCYIDDTGHFNSVEFNICYNQMLYLLLAHGVASQRIPALGHWTLQSFFEKQLPSILIGRFASRFLRPINPRSFRGTIELEPQSNRSARALFLNTRAYYTDAGGGAADGEITISIME